MTNNAMFGSDQDPPRSAVRRLLPMLIGSAVVLLLVLLGFVALQRKGPRMEEGRTVYEGVVRRGEPAFEQYRRYLRLVSAAGQVSENLLGERQAVVAGEIANSGSRVIDVVEITATLLDFEGRPIASFTKTPIKPALPLQPMEIRRFSVWVEPFPDDWLSGIVDVEVHGYRVRQ